MGAKSIRNLGKTTTTVKQTYFPSVLQLFF